MLPKSITNSPQIVTLHAEGEAGCRPSHAVDVGAACHPLVCQIDQTQLRCMPTLRDRIIPPMASFPTNGGGSITPLRHLIFVMAIHPKRACPPIGMAGSMRSQKFKPGLAGAEEPSSADLPRNRRKVHKSNQNTDVNSK